MMVLLRFYLEESGDPFWEEKYKQREVPPIPRLGEKVVLGAEVYKVVESPTHYFERKHEIALTLKPLPLVEEEEAAKKIAPPVTKSTHDSQGCCVYCGGEDCVGGEECDFYDGTLA